MQDETRDLNRGACISTSFHNCESKEYRTNTNCFGFKMMQAMNYTTVVRFYGRAAFVFSPQLLDWLWGQLYLH
jgi:hypothetical protein